MGEREAKDWSKAVSNQIAVHKTNNALLELCDRLKPASYLFPAHIHATGQESEEGRSLIRLNMLDYSKGTGEATVQVYANISPEDTRYIYSAAFGHLMDFEFYQEKIFGEPDGDGLSMVTKVWIRRAEVDEKGNLRNNPWIVKIENGGGKITKNKNGGKYCAKGSYICDAAVKLNLTDRDLFALFCKANSYLNVFEQEMAYKQNRIGNFNSLYKLLDASIQKNGREVIRRLEMEKPEKKAA